MKTKKIIPERIPNICMNSLLYIHMKLMVKFIVVADAVPVATYGCADGSQLLAD